MINAHTKRLLVLNLSFLSGVCGIAYEVLYARMLTTYLGDMFFIAGSILASFLFCLGVGSFIAHRFSRHLYLIEWLIGLYAIGVALLFHFQAADIASALAPHSLQQPWVIMASIFFLLAIPAGLIGFSVPLFTHYVEHYSSEDNQARSFRHTYFFYNLGAAVCVLAIEYWLLRSFGLYIATLGIAAINIVTGAGLLLLGRPLADSQPAVVKTKLPIPFSAALFLVSVASGIFQLLFLKISNAVFGPYHENFALTIAVVLIGLAIGAWGAGRIRMDFRRFLYASTLLLALVYLALGPWIHFWANANASIGVAANVSGYIKIAMLFIYGLLPFSIFGATIPLLLREHSGCNATPGKLLGISSFGNVVGYLLMVGVLHALLEDRYTALITLLAVAVASVLVAKAQNIKTHVYRPLILSLGGGVLMVSVWPSYLFALGYGELASPVSIARLENELRLNQDFRKYDTSVGISELADGTRVVVINGYLSLALDPDGMTHLRETVVGSTPALFSAKREKALVLGLGTGVTAAATTALYGNTRIVEINPLMIELLPRFKDYNLDIANNPTAQIELDDGLTALLRSDERYDAIVNTVTSPLFFSSAKLYTKDFFQLAASRLAQGGVYSLWFDGEVTQEGAKIIFQSLKESFRDCVFTYLNAAYSQVICGNGPLQARPVGQWPESLTAKFGDYRLGMDIDQFLGALVLREHRLFNTDWASPVNTFDRPVLEFSMAENILSKMADDKPWDPYLMLGINFRHNAYTGYYDDWRGFGARCAALNMIATSFPCPGLLGREGLGRLPDEYIAPVSSHYLTRSDGMPMLLALTESYQRIGDAEAVLQLVTQMEQLPPKALEQHRAQVAMIKAGALLSLNRNVDDATLQQLFRLSPIDPNTRKLIGKVMQMRGDPQTARLNYFIAENLELQ